jgi:hypothetical protein
MRLYRIPFSTNVERVALALAHKGLAVERVWIDYAADCAAFPFLEFAAGRPPEDDELFPACSSAHDVCQTARIRLEWVVRLRAGFPVAPLDARVAQI